MLVCWIISFAFPYPANCTQEILLDLIRTYAKEWMGWPRFPWRITRDLHNFIDEPPVNFHYLLIQQCVTAFACDAVLTGEFVCLEDVLDMMIRRRFEFVGVMRHELIRALQALREDEGKSYIPDCSGAADGHSGVSDKEIARRREAVKKAFDKARKSFVRILNYASQEPNRKKHVAGHSLDAWDRGDSMPSPVELMVMMEPSGGDLMISPQPDEVSQFARVGRTVPKLVVRGLTARSLVRVVDERKGSQGAVGRGQRAAGKEPARKVEIVGDCAGIRVQGQKDISLASRHKLRAVLRFICEHVKATGDAEFRIDKIREKFNDQFPENLQKRAWRSDRFREDLFRGLEKAFDLLFETIDKSDGKYRLRV